MSGFNVRVTRLEFVKFREMVEYHEVSPGEIVHTIVNFAIFFCSRCVRGNDCLYYVNNMQRDDETGKIEFDYYWDSKEHSLDLSDFESIPQRDDATFIPIEGDEALMLVLKEVADTYMCSLPAAFRFGLMQLHHYFNSCYLKGCDMVILGPNVLEPVIYWTHTDISTLPQFVADDM